MEFVNPRWEKIKKHVKEHKIAYTNAATAVVFTGITWAIMRSNVLRGGACESGLRGGPTNTASLVFRNKQTINVTTVLDREGRGHPGWPVRNVETKQVYLTQGAAAKAAGVTESLMSAHINGKFPDIDGLHYERVNLLST